MTPSDVGFSSWIFTSWSHSTRSPTRTIRAPSSWSSVDGRRSRRPDGGARRTWPSRCLRDRPTNPDWNGQAGPFDCRPSQKGRPPRQGESRRGSPRPGSTGRPDGRRLAHQRSDPDLRAYAIVGVEDDEGLTRGEWMLGPDTRPEQRPSPVLRHVVRRPRRLRRLRPGLCRLNSDPHENPSAGLDRPV